MRRTPSVAPSVSASGFSWLTARTRRADRIRFATSCGTAPTYASSETLIAGPCAVSWASPCARPRGDTPCVATVDAPRRVREPPTAARRRDRPPGGRARPAPGATPAAAPPGRDRRGERLRGGRVRVRTVTGIELRKQVEDPRPAFGCVVEMDVQVGDAFD